MSCEEMFDYRRLFFIVLVYYQLACNFLSDWLHIKLKIYMEEKRQDRVIYM
jgi:hypothetical protein